LASPLVRYMGFYGGRASLPLPPASPLPKAAGATFRLLALSALARTGACVQEHAGAVFRDCRLTAASTVFVASQHRTHELVTDITEHRNTNGSHAVLTQRVAAGRTPCCHFTYMDVDRSYPPCLLLRMPALPTGVCPTSGCLRFTASALFLPLAYLGMIGSKTASVHDKAFEERRNGLQRRGRSPALRAFLDGIKHSFATTKPGRAGR